MTEVSRFIDLKNYEEVRDDLESKIKQYREWKMEGHPFNWDPYRIGVFGYFNITTCYLLLNTQGVPEHLYNSTCDWDIDITEDVEEYCEFETEEEGEDYLNMIIENTLDGIIEKID